MTAPQAVAAAAATLLSPLTGALLQASNIFVSALLLLQSRLYTCQDSVWQL
jgi:hypothetical protein